MPTREQLSYMPVEAAVRRAIGDGEVLHTPASGSEFKVASMNREHLVLLLGATAAWTPIAWECLEGVPAFLVDREWVVIRSRDDTARSPVTLEGYVRRYLKRAAAAYVAAVLEGAEVVEVRRARPAQCRLHPTFITRVEALPPADL